MLQTYIILLLIEIFNKKKIYSTRVQIAIFSEIILKIRGRVAIYTIYTSMRNYFFLSLIENGSRLFHFVLVQKTLMFKILK